LLPNIKSVSLISRDDAGYREYCKRICDSKNINRATSTPDRKATISRWMEHSLNQVLSQKYIKVDTDIITWLELNRYGSYSRRYKEIDGFYKSEDFYLLLEVKASISKSNFTKGRSQVNTNLDLISMIHSNTIAILALADCRYYDFEFGYAMDKVLETMANGSTYVLNEGLELPKISFESRKILWIIQETEVLALADTYGPPYDLDPDYDL
jgi:hypothetical protein